MIYALPGSADCMYTVRHKLCDPTKFNVFLIEVKSMSNLELLFSDWLIYFRLCTAFSLCNGVRGATRVFVTFPEVPHSACFFHEP